MEFKNSISLNTKRDKEKTRPFEDAGAKILKDFQAEHPDVEITVLFDEDNLRFNQITQSPEGFLSEDILSNLLKRLNASASQLGGSAI